MYINKSPGWLVLAVAAGLLLGSNMLLFRFLSPNIKKNKSAMFGYGLLLFLVRIPIALLLFYMWSKNKDDYELLKSETNVLIVLLTAAVSLLIPILSVLVVNMGGSIGQLTTSIVSFLPLFIGGYLLFGDKINKVQMVGVVFSVIGFVLMSQKNHVVKSMTKATAAASSRLSK